MMWGKYSFNKYILYATQTNRQVITIMELTRTTYPHTVFQHTDVDRL